jgi:hypothetical protein
MIDALHKVKTPLMERYDTTCVSCGWYRHFFGMKKEARVYHEQAYCPHCRLLVKEKP